MTQSSEFLLATFLFLVTYWCHLRSVTGHNRGSIRSYSIIMCKLWQVFFVLEDWCINSLLLSSIFFNPSMHLYSSEIIQGPKEMPKNAF